MLDVSDRAAALIDLPALLRCARPAGPLGRAAQDASRPFGPGQRAEWAAERKACDVLASGVAPGTGAGLEERLEAIEAVDATMARAAAGDADEADLFRLKRFLFHNWRILGALAELGIAKGYETPPLDAASTERALRILQPSGELRSRFALADEAHEDLAPLRAHLRAQRGEEAALSRALKSEVEQRWEVSARTGVVVIPDPAANKERIAALLASGSFELAATAAHQVELRILPSPAHGALREAIAADTARLDALEAECAAALGARAAAAAPEVVAQGRWLGRLDLRLAKVRLATRWGCWPKPSDTTEVVGGWLPGARERLEGAGGRWQPVDVEVARGVTLLTGPNMGGKTAAMAVIAGAQVLAQYGYPVPAQAASFRWLDYVDYIGGELGSFASGLSSFAGEMSALAGVLRRRGAGLVLIDELASGTGPDEGEAVASATVSHLSEADHTAVVVTHYPGLCAERPLRRLRVRGLAAADPESLRRDAEERGWKVALNSVMDFALVEDDGQWTGSDALRIAELLDLPTDLIAEARSRLGARNPPR